MTPPRKIEKTETEKKTQTDSAAPEAPKKRVTLKTLKRAPTSVLQSPTLRKVSRDMVRRVVQL